MSDSEHHLPMVIGLREWVALPELGIDALRMKVDTGAATSALHASDIELFERDGQTWLRFTAHTGIKQHVALPGCEALLLQDKRIRSSNGHVQHRYVIRTLMQLGERLWPVDMTLTCRKAMRFRGLLGAKAMMSGNLLVNPALTYVQGKPTTR